VAVKAAAIAAVGAVTIAAGVGWIYPPAGLIAAGIELVVAGYVTAYLGARRTVEVPRRPGP
jgi:hypothetical protein